MLCTKAEPPPDPLRCPCKSCKLRNVTSSEIEVMKQERGLAKKKQEDSQQPTFPFGQHKKPLLILVVNKRKIKRRRNVPQPENADSVCYCDEPTCMSAQKEGDRNKYYENREPNYGLPSQSEDPLCYCHKSDPISSCECDQDLIKNEIVEWLNQNSETTLPASSTATVQDQGDTFKSKKVLESRKFKKKRSDGKINESDKTNADGDFRDRCKMQRMCGKPHPILIKKPTCNEQLTKKKGKRKSGVCDPFDSSDECDENEGNNNCSCWCDIERLEKTLKNIIPNEDCLCYCKKMAKKTPNEIAAIARKERQKKYELLKKRKELERKRRLKEEMLKRKYQRFPSVPPPDLSPRPAYLDCCRWCPDKMPVPLSCYSIDYSPTSCFRSVNPGWRISI